MKLFTKHEQTQRYRKQAWLIKEKEGERFGV